MENWSSHGILWWSVDNNSAIFCLRSFKCSMETGNWENWHSKLYSIERIYTTYIGKDNPYFLYWQKNIESYAQNNWKVENFCSQFSQWPSHVPNPKTWTRWHISICYSPNPERACSINSIWNTELVQRWQLVYSRILTRMRVFLMLLQTAVGSVFRRRLQFIYLNTF
jgi:hypothetical protein